MEVSERSPLVSPTNSAKNHSHKKKHKKKKSFCDAKLVSFVVIGGLTFLYVLGELGIAVYTNSLVLLSDGFHNLSDVVSLVIAFWARKASKRQMSDAMSYGWARSETLGGLTNGCFLLSLCLYVLLQSIPKFIHPEPIESGWPFIIVAATGLGLNTIGTIVFAITGQGHSHSHGHGHDHGHGHGHSHKKEKKKNRLSVNNGKHDNHDHDHDHDKKKKKKEKSSHDHGHSHSHDGDHKKKKKEKKWDANVQAIFLHYLGDAISSALVLAAGLLIHFFHKAKWVEYIDPASSLIIVVLIFWTTVPLIKRCGLILLQSTPTNITPEKVRKNILGVDGVLNVHDFHIWQLVDGLTICSVHVTIEEGTDFAAIVTEVKAIFHKYGIHSSAIQPEFAARDFKSKEFCLQNCVEECKEDWCCKPGEGMESEPNSARASLIASADQDHLDV